jgi:hypothetical protein
MGGMGDFLLYKKLCIWLEICPSTMGNGTDLFHALIRKPFCFGNSSFMLRVVAVPGGRLVGLGSIVIG